jgi:2-oxoglutarate ferredoxin oxidoreductase subunit gamma
MRYEIRLGGSGGQGLVFAGIVLAEAAGIHDGHFVAQSQSYGPEARGGKSRSDVIISDEEIDFPHAQSLDCLVAMNQDSFDAYYKLVKPGGVIVVDSTQVSQTVAQDALEFPFTKLAKEKVGREITSTIMALGALAAITGKVTMSGLRAAVKARAPGQTSKINLKALKLGEKTASGALKGR